MLEIDPDPKLAGIVGEGDLEQFKAVGRAMLEWFKAWGALQPHERVLEVGCGVGRIAMPLATFLTSGRYDGFDIVPEPVEWCRRNITPRHPNFNFFRADVRNGVFNPRGGQAVSAYAFPYEDETFDFVILTSVFTRMRPEDLERYAAEIGRVLKPGGRCFCTAYLISGEASEALRSGMSVRPFRRAGAAHWVEATTSPEASVAYDEEHFAAVLRRSGLHALRVVSGEWWKQASAQDIFIARKAVPAVKALDFRCNVCGHRNSAVPLDWVTGREYPSCAWCQSSLRMRSLMRALSLELYGSVRALPDFPEDKSVRGLGMSDWEGYAKRLAQKMDYANTHYNREPRLDITDIPAEMAGRYRFLLSGDVFEHIPCFALERAFRNSRRLLEAGGIFVFTVPFTKEGETQEHFPRLHDFRIVEENGKRVLRNTTVAGEEEVFENLVFHGGEGMTLEMRIFSEPDLVRRLREAGFSEVKICAEHAPELGIVWPMDWAVPIVARA